MSHHLRKKYDIIVNGGGIVGFTFLNLILKSPYLKRCKVLLIEQAARPSDFKQPPRHLDPSRSDIDWDQTDSQEYKERAFSNRVSSITPSSKNVFDSLGVWDSLKTYSKDVNKIKVWSYDYSHKMIFKQQTNDCSSQDKKIVFSVVENNRLVLALLDSLRNQKDKDLPIAWTSTLKQMNPSHEKGLIDVVAEDCPTSEEFVVSAPLILGCDGYNSKVRQLAKIESTEFNLNKTAVVGTVKLESSSQLNSSQNEIAFQRFSAEHDTVAALLPLDNEYSSFVISAPNQYAEHLRSCDDKTFISEFNCLLSVKESPGNPILRNLHGASNVTCEAIHSCVKSLVSYQTPNEEEFNSEVLEEFPRIEFVVENSRAAFPLVTQLALPKMMAPLSDDSYNQVALLGDSSHRIHPLAGQGLNLGIQDAVTLVKLFEESAAYGEKIFDEQDLTLLSKLLERYNLKRQAYILPMAAGIHGMPLLFKLVPSEMISFFNRIDPLKSTFVKVAGG